MRAQGMMIGRDSPATIDDYAVPGALMLSSGTPLLTASGQKLYADDIRDCLRLAGQVQQAPDGPDGPETCLIERDLHITVTYQPADRYWAFQWTELAGSFALTALLSGLLLWRIRRAPG